VSTRSSAPALLPSNPDAGAFFGTYELTKKYTGNYFYEELHGLADASGADYRKILGIHMIGEVTKGACSMFGAWGAATASTGSLLQLRALDWDVDGPFKNFPQITVYHSTNSSDGNTFANVGWTGWLGSITGINDKRMVQQLHQHFNTYKNSDATVFFRQSVKSESLSPTKRLAAKAASAYPSLSFSVTFCSGTTHSTIASTAWPTPSALAT
jgi:hypothetical protein